MHLQGQDVRPGIVAVCDADPAAMAWFTNPMPGVRTYAEYADLLADGEVEAVYCAVPHNLHAQIYGDILRAGKHLSERSRSALTARRIASSPR